MHMQKDAIRSSTNSLRLIHERNDRVVLIDFSRSTCFFDRKLFDFCWHDNRADPKKDEWAHYHQSQMESERLSKALSTMIMVTFVISDLVCITSRLFDKLSSIEDTDDWNIDDPSILTHSFELFRKVRFYNEKPSLTFVRWVYRSFCLFNALNRWNKRNSPHYSIDLRCSSICKSFHLNNPCLSSWY